MGVRFYEGLLSGSLPLGGGEQCRYWQAFVLEIDLSSGSIKGTVSRTELRKEIHCKTEPQEGFPPPWNTHLQGCGSCLEEVSGKCAGSGMVVLESTVIREIQHSSISWEKCSYSLQASSDGAVLSGKVETLSGNRPLEWLRLVERPAAQSRECRWEGLETQTGRMDDGHFFQYWQLVVLHWDPCIGKVECSLSRIECLKEADGCAEPQPGFPDYLKSWLTTFGASMESISVELQQIQLHVANVRKR